MTPGLMTRKWEEKSKMTLLNIIHDVTGLKVNKLNEED